jgi:hypothetical protein
LFEYGSKIFCWGDPLDIAEFHGVGDGNLWSVWLVVDAIHQSPELNFFSKTHADQTECANGFCIGTNGGILVWILSAAWIANFARDM